MPYVNVIMPVYNAERYVKEAVESLINQTFKDFKIYIINDGSTDNTLSIINNFNSKKIEIINNEVNLGIVHTLNKGLYLASDCKYIARMDADDVNLPNRLYLQQHFMKNNPSIDILGGASEHFSMDKIGRKKYQPIHHKQIITGFLNYNTISHPTVMVKSEVFWDVKYSNDYPGYEDYNLWVNLIGNYKFHNLDNIILKYRRHEANITNKYKYDPSKDFNNFSQILEKYNEVRQLGLVKDEIDFLSVISAKSRYSICELDKFLLAKFTNDILKKVDRNGLDADYIYIIITANILMYLMHTNRVKELFKFVSNFKFAKNLYNIFMAKYNGKINLS